MVSYFVRRALAVVPVLVLISIGIFLLVRLAPGDPVLMQLDPEVAASDSTYVERRRAELGLNKPVPLQYIAWAGEVAQGNLGFSFVTRRPVIEMVRERIMPTVRLMGTGIGIGLLLSIPLGIIAALRKNTSVDYATAVVSLSAISIPNFFLGLAAIFVFGLTLGWLPTSGMGSGGLWNSIRYLIMPAGILGFGLSGPLVRYVRSGLLDELNKDYVETAIAKGASQTRVVVRHALRNSLIPLITVIAIYIPQLLAGAVVLEQIFAWPGMGRLVLSSVSQRDYPVIIGFTIFVGLLVVVSNLIADLLYATTDPRIRLR